VIVAPRSAAAPLGEALDHLAERVVAIDRKPDYPERGSVKVYMEGGV